MWLTILSVVSSGVRVPFRNRLSMLNHEMVTMYFLVSTSPNPAHSRSRPP